MADGVIVYEAAGENLPLTAAGLNGALAGAVNDAQRLLPWRRGVDNRLKGLEQPKPQPEPQPQPQPQPQPIDDGGKPVVDQVDAEWDCPWYLLAPICGVAAVVGLLLGYARKRKDGQATRTK